MNSRAGLGMWLGCWMLGCWMMGSGVGLSGDPTPEKPMESLNAVGVVPASVELFKRAEEREQAIRKGLEKAEKAKKIEAGLVNELIRDIHALRNFASRLQFYGETAATDWRMRVEVYDKYWQKVLERYGSQNNGDGVRTKALSSLEKSQKNRLGRLQSIRKLLEQNEWYEAEEKMDQVWDEFWSVAGFLGVADRDPFYKPCEETNALVTQKTRMDRLKVGKEVLEGEAQRSYQNYRKLIDDAKLAAEQIKSMGIADLGGTKMKGPEVVQAIADEWKLANLALQRAAVLQRAIPHEGTGIARGMDKTARSEEWAETAKGLMGELKIAVREVIDADASKATSSEAMKHFHLYLKALGPMGSRSRSMYWTDDLHDALGRMAARGGAEREFKAYSEATGELLQWRAKVAVQQAQAMKGEYPAMGPMVENVLVKRADRIGLYAEDGPYKPIPLMKHSIPETMPVVGEGLLNKQVMIEGAVQLDSDKPKWMTRLDHNIYCRVTGVLALPEYVKQMQAELMVDERNPPLSILAATAIASAERGDYQAVGGTLSGVSLEATTARFATLPASASPIIPLGEVVGGGQGNIALEGLVLRCNLAPVWVQHRYFFAKLPSE